MASVHVTFDESKETPGTFQFKERLGPLDEAKLRTIYVPKRTLKELGWEPGKPVTVDVSVD